MNNYCKYKYIWELERPRGNNWYTISGIRHLVIGKKMNYRIFFDENRLYGYYITSRDKISNFLTARDGLYVEREVGFLCPGDKILINSKDPHFRINF